MMGTISKRPLLKNKSRKFWARYAYNIFFNGLPLGSPQHVLAGDGKNVEASVTELI